MQFAFLLKASYHLNHSGEKMYKIIINIFFFIFSISTIGGNYDTINDIGFPDTNTSSWRGGQFIKPNEINPSIFRNVLEDRTGILISVGTLRTLIAFAMGNFKYLVMMDLNPQTRSFNRDLLDYIKSLTVKYPNEPNRQREAFEKSEYFFPNVYAYSYFWGNNKIGKRSLQLF